jgi:hypothetical protein
MYYIYDDQQQWYLEWSEKSIRDCIKRLISFHSIDTYTSDIYMLLELWWTINDWTNNTNYNNKVINMFKQWKGKRLFKKIRNKYMSKWLERILFIN